MNAVMVAATTTLTAELCNGYSPDKTTSAIKAALSSIPNGTGRKTYVKCMILANYFRLLSSLHVYRERGAVLDFIIRHHSGNNYENDFFYKKRSGAV
jgi:hypothetical protein